MKLSQAFDYSDFSRVGGYDIDVLDTLNIDPAGMLLVGCSSTIEFRFEDQEVSLKDGDCKVQGHYREEGEGPDWVPCEVWCEFRVLYSLTEEGTR